MRVPPTQPVLDPVLCPVSTSRPCPPACFCFASEHRCTLLPHMDYLGSSLAVDHPQPQTPTPPTNDASVHIHVRVRYVEKNTLVVSSISPALHHEPASTWPGQSDQQRPGRTIISFLEQ